jgi:Tol biopolymer transport system component
MRLTTEAARDEAPSWSRDGKWIYFASQRSGRWETWRVPAGGGEAVRVTRTGGGTAFESSDGQSVYYIRAVLLEASDLVSKRAADLCPRQTLIEARWLRLNR